MIFFDLSLGAKLSLIKLMLRFDLSKQVLDGWIQCPIGPRCCIHQRYHFIGRRCQLFRLLHLCQVSPFLVLVTLDSSEVECDEILTELKAEGDFKSFFFFARLDYGVNVCQVAKAGILVYLVEAGWCLSLIK